MKIAEAEKKSLSVNPELFSHLPVAFALMEVTRENGTIKKVSYAYVNERFCELSMRGEKEFLGKDISEVHSQKAKETWLSYIATIETSKEAIKGSCFYAPLGGYVNYIVSPTHDPDFFAVMYINADVQEEEFRTLRHEKLVNEANLELAQKISASAMDEDSLSSLLKAIAQKISAKRVFFVKLGKEKAIIAQYKESEDLPDPIPPTSEAITALLPRAKKMGEPLILDEKKAEEGDEASKTFLSFGVKTHMAFPFINEGRLAACLCADDYPIQKEETAKKILQNSCYFMTFKWANTLLLKELRYRARRDQLTGLLNRYGYEEAVKNYFEANPEDPCVLGLIDIDDFKNINDLYGHQIGDTALQTLSAGIKDFFGEDAIIGRFGGDEISLLLPRQTASSVQEAFTKFASSRHCFSTGKGEVNVAVSVGYVEYPSQAKDYTSLLLCADKACYAAKLFGKGQSLQYQKGFDNLDKTALGLNFHSIADNLPVPFFLFGNRGEIYYANSLCLTLLGYDNLLDLASKNARGVYSLFEESDVLKALLRDAQNNEKTALLTLNSGKKVNLLITAKHGLPSSVRYGVLLEK